jgi:hypothetical protein
MDVTYATAIKNQFWDTVFLIWVPIIRTRYLREQGCEDPPLFFEVKRDFREQKRLKRSAFIDMLPPVTGKVITVTIHERLI